MESIPETLDGYKFHHLLGEGKSGKVVLALQISTDELRAVKILSKKHNDFESVHKESRILKQVRTSPFCTYAYDTLLTEDYVCFIMEYLSGGNLYDFYEQWTPVDIETTRFLTAEILFGLQFLHGQGIVHWDLKPENILLDSVGHVRIADFGLSTMGVEKSRTLTGWYGTQMYMAPEIFLGLPYGFAVDYFSLGIIVYELAIGYYPFNRSKTELDTDSECESYIESSTNKELKNSICNQHPSFPMDFSMDLQDLIGDKLLCKCPDTRQKLVKHLRRQPFFKEVDWVELEAGKVDPPWTMETNPDEEEEDQFTKED